MGASSRKQQVLTMKDTSEQVERKYIREVLERVQWWIRGKQGAAEILGVLPTTLHIPNEEVGYIPSKTPAKPPPLRQSERRYFVTVATFRRFSSGCVRHGLVQCQHNLRTKHRLRLIPHCRQQWHGYCAREQESLGKPRARKMSGIGCRAPKDWQQKDPGGRDRVMRNETVNSPVEFEEGTAVQRGWRVAKFDGREPGSPNR